MRRYRCLCFPFVAGLICLLPSTGRAQFFTVADTNTAIPGGSGDFTSFGSFPTISGGTIAFFGAGSSSQQGIYTGSGGSLTVIATTSTAIPDGTGNFSTLSTEPTISGGTVAFWGNGSQQGIYTGSGGALTVIANTNTAIPSGTGNFTSLDQYPSNSGGMVAFFGAGASSQQGIYTGNGGALTVIANTNTAIPSGSGNFTSFSNNGTGISISGATVAFLGYGSGSQGIYTGSGGTLTVIANTSTAIPNGSGNFTTFNNAVPVISGGTVAFFGAGSGSQQGIYTGSGAAITTIANLNTAIPLGSGNFTSFSSFEVSISGTEVAFYGSGSGGSGIYAANTNGTGLIKVVATGDRLDGSTVSALSFSSFGLSGNEATFEATLANGTSGIFYTIVAIPTPEPHHILLVCAAALGLLQVIRRLRFQRGCGVSHDLT